MPGENKVANPQPVVSGEGSTATGPANGNPPQQKSFFQKYAGSVIQMIIIWVAMRAISNGKFS